MPTLLERGKVTDEQDNILNPYVKSIDYVIDQISKSKEPTSIGDKVWLLEAKTASGKSTILPPYLRRKFIGNKRMIVCTQPRIYNTISIPEQIASYNQDMVIGDNLGFSTSIKKVLVKGEGLMFVTIDTLLDQIKRLEEETFIQKYSHIIVDEVHVRNIGLDILFYKLKLMLLKHYKDINCPTLIFMSATFDIKKFASYFETTNILRVQGFTFPVEPHFLQAPVSDTIENIAHKVVEIHEENPDPLPVRDILVFINGAMMAEKLQESILKRLEGKRKIEIIIALANTIVDVKPLIEKKSNIRRVILGSNAIETGVTVDTLKYVIDPGWAMISEYNPSTNTRSLLSKPIDQGAATQRMGRVGRKAPGICYRMYTEETFNELRKNALPDILTNDVSEALMYLLIDRFEFDMKTLDDILKFRDRIAEQQMILVQRGRKKNTLDQVDMLDKPSGESIARSMEILHHIGAIDKNNMPTVMGLVMHKFSRLSMEARKVFLSGVIFNVSLKDLNIMVWMLNNSVDLKDDKKLLNEYMGLGLFRDLKWPAKFYPMILDKGVDYILLYYVFRKKLKVGHTFCQLWCKEVGLNYHTMIVAISMAYDTLKVCSNIGFKYEVSNAYSFKKEVNHYIKTDDYPRYIAFIKRFKLCVYQGYKKNMAIYKDGTYQTNNGRQLKLRIDNNPKHVLYYNSILKDNFGKIKLVIGEYSIMSGYVGCDDNFY